MMGLSWWLSGKESICQCKKHGFDPCSRKIPHAVKQLSPCTTTIQPVLQGPGAATIEPQVPQSLSSAIREATAMRSQYTKTREQPLFTATREKPAQQRGPSTTKHKIIFKKNLKSTPWEMGNQSQDHCRTTQIQTLSNDMAFLRSWMLRRVSLISLRMWLL